MEKPQASSTLSFLTKPSLHALMILAIGLLAYSNTFHVPFQFDDAPFIVENSHIKDLTLFFQTSEGSLKSNRLVAYLTFALNYAIHGPDVTGYHIVNVAIHIANALLVYWLVTFTFRIPSSPFGPKEQGDPSTAINTSAYLSGYSLAALFAALLFVSHPLQTQAVTYITQRFASLATLFYLLSLVCYVRARSEKIKGGITFISTLTVYVFSLIFAFLAMKTKEISFTLPIIVALYEFMFLQGKGGKRFLFLLPFLLTMFVIPYTVLGTDKPLGELISDVSEATRVQTVLPRVDYLFTQFRGIVTYVRLLFLPMNQNLDYDYPVYRSLSQPPVFFSLLLLLSVLALGVSSYRRSLKGRNNGRAFRLISFGLFWFFITLSTESSVIPIADVFFEHRAYLPSVGFFLALSSFVTVMVPKLKSTRQNALLAACSLIILVLVSGTHARNRVWQNEMTLWEDVVMKSPAKERGYYNLGTAYKDHGLPDKALEFYNIALDLSPHEDAELYNNIGTAYAAKGLADEAIRYYQVAVMLRPDYGKAYNNLGVAYEAKGLINKAIAYYQVAIEREAYKTEFHYNLGNAYLAGGSYDQAINQYQVALRLNPYYEEAYTNLGAAYAAKGQVDDAIRHYQIALRLKPDDAIARGNLELAYERKGLHSIPSP